MGSRPSNHLLTRPSNHLLTRPPVGPSGSAAPAFPRPTPPRGPTAGAHPSRRRTTGNGRYAWSSPLADAFRAHRANLTTFPFSPRDEGLTGAPSVRELQAHREAMRPEV